MHESMGSDKKIRQWRAPGSASTPIGEKTFASQERGFPRQGAALENIRGQRLFKLLHAIESNGYFRVDYRIDDQP